MSKSRRSIADKLVTLFVVAFFVFAAIYFIGNEFDAFGYADSKTEHDEKSDNWRVFGFVFERTDTVAQWVMMFFTVVAAALLWGTLREANKTNAYAIKAALAATEANEIMRQDQRPWVNIEFNHKDFFGPDSPDHNGVFACKIKYRLKNEGKTPAFNVGGIIKVFEHDAPSQLVRHAKSLAENLRITLMHDQSSVLFPSETVEAEEIKEFFLEKGARARSISLIIMVIYDLDQSTDAKGVYIRCFTLNATYERGVKTNEVIPHEEIEARVVL